VEPISGSAAATRNGFEFIDGDGEKIGGSKFAYLLVLVEGDPDVDLVHGLPEEERPEGHRKVGRDPHHLPHRSPLAALLSSALPDGLGDLRRRLPRHSRGSGHEVISLWSPGRPGMLFWAERILGPARPNSVPSSAQKRQPSTDSFFLELCHGI
jgi:hypothetical protein